MAAWSDGYVTDVPYTSQYYGEMAPGYLAFACVRQGARPPSLAPGGAYLELGCGQGYGLNLLAAANPGLDFFGVDFHPGQIANARRLQAAAGLSNVTFEDFSFEQMLDLPADRLPQFDVIALHGIYSWVNAHNREVIVRLLDRLLKPGGMVYVSYNSLPTWAIFAPLQRFIFEHAARATGDPRIRVVNALRAALQLCDDKAAFFEHAPAVRSRIELDLKADPAYLVHEYLHEDCRPFYHAEVARALEGARLSFAASGGVADDIIHLAAPASLRATIQDTQDRTWRETLLDYAANKPFRRDIFLRGGERLATRERDALLEATRFTLLAPHEAMTFEFTVPTGGLKGNPAVYRPIVEALADGPLSYGELTRLPSLAGAAAGAVFQALTLLVGGRRIHPVAEVDLAAAAPAFNRAVLDRIAFDEFPSHLACPLAGSAVRVEFADLLALNLPDDTGNALALGVRAGWEMMARTNRRLLKDGVAIPDQAGNEAALRAHFEAFNRTKRPLFRRLGVI